MILVSDKAHVRTITLNRPDAMNAFNGALFDSLTQGLLEAGEDSNVRVVVLTGKGKAFSTGLDISEVGKDMEPPKHGVPGLFRTLVDFPKPLLLAINVCRWFWSNGYWFRIYLLYGKKRKVTNSFYLNGCGG